MTRRAARESGKARARCPVFHSSLRTAALALVALGVASGAGAAPPENADPALAPWFQSLQAPNGISCCSVADCRTTDYRTSEWGYEALIDERWISVPQDRVLNRVANPTGRAVVCFRPGIGILCFVRPSES